MMVKTMVVVVVVIITYDDSDSDEGGGGDDERTVHNCEVKGNSGPRMGDHHKWYGWIQAILTAEEDLVLWCVSIAPQGGGGRKDTVFP